MPAASASIVTAIPGAFLACVQCFKLVQFGRNFEDDYALVAADLKICEIRILRWGNAAGLADETQSQETAQHTEKLSKYPPDELRRAEAVLKRIVAIFNSTKEKCEFESIDDNDTADPLSENEQAQQEEQSIIVQSHRHLNKVRAMYSKGVDKVKDKFSSASDKSKWALYKKEHLTELVRQVSELIDRLEKLFPELVEDEKRMAREEVKDVPQTLLGQLAELAKSDPALTQALQAEARSQGTSLENVWFQGNAITRIGDDYAAGEKGHTRGSHNVRMAVFDGDARTHLGDTIGFKERSSLTQPAAKDETKK
jgi:hypothetical protein